MLKVSKIKGFEWDNGNALKNWLKHKVTTKECEEVFLDKNLKIFKDPLHSQKEKRYIILGRTLAGRLLFVVFTVRGEKIRVIFVRDLKKKKEIKLYQN